MGRTITLCLALVALTLTPNVVWAASRVDNRLIITSPTASTNYATWSQAEVELTTRSLASLTGNFTIDVPTTAALYLGTNNELSISAAGGFATLLTLTGNTLHFDDAVDPRASIDNDGTSLTVLYDEIGKQSWSATASRLSVPLGIGVAPSAQLHVKGAVSTAGGLRIEDSANNRVRLNIHPVDSFNVGLTLGQSAGNFRLLSSGSSEFARFDPTTTNPTFFTSKKFTVGAADGLSVFNVEGGATIGSSSYVGNATYTAANGEIFLERNLLIGDVTSSGTALINMGTNRTGSLPLIAMSNSGSGDAVVLVTNAGNVWEWGSRNSATGDPFVIGGGTSPTVTDLIFITKGGEMGIGAAVPSAMLDVVAGSTYNAPVLELSQGSDNYPFMSFIGDEDPGAPGNGPVTSAVSISNLSEFDLLLEVKVNGVSRWIPTVAK